MQISTTARHCELDPEVRWFVQQRLDKLGRFARDIQEAHLIVTAEGYRHSAEITLKLRHGEMVSHEEATEARTAIDLAVDRLEKQLRKFKEKRVSRKRAARSNGKTGRHPAEIETGNETETGEEPFEEG
jgi:putative sigma-54 modulation protein